MMMRVLVATLATTGALARWSDVDSTKEMAKQALERRHNLAEQHQKGYEKRQKTTKVILSDEQKQHIASRMLKRTREVATTKDTGTSSIRASAAIASARGGSTKEDGPGKVKKEDARTTMDGQDDPPGMNNLNSHLDMGKNIVMTASNPKSGKTSPAPGKASGKSKEPSNGPSLKSKTSKTSGKTRKISTGICTKRLDIAYEQIIALGSNGPFGTIDTPSDVTDLCAFVPPEDEEDDYNFGCPFLFIPPLGFIQGEEEYIDILGEEAGMAFNSLVLYCQCYQGFDLGCADKIPHGPPTTEKEYETKTVLVNSYSEFIPFSTPAVRAEYCKMVGVWNGDFESDVALDFSPDVTDCGCFFVGTAKDMVGTCPGVDLGAFFEFPQPTPPEETFYDGFEEAEFPDQGWWSVNSGDIFSSRRNRQLNGHVSSSDWALTTQEAYEGDYSIKSPDLSNDEFTPRWANATLEVSEDWGTPGTLTFYVLAPLGDDDYLEWIVDDKPEGIAEAGDEWEMHEIYIGGGSHEVTWSYLYNPLKEDDPDVGAAYVDEIYFVPGEDMPTELPTYFPTFSPTGFPTLSPTVEAR